MRLIRVGKSGEGSFSAFMALRVSTRVKVKAP
jgi:hypothetical protein